MAVSKRLKFEILRRDNHACRYCGQVAPEVKLTVDHVIPVALGGTDDPANLVAACVDCNSGKSSVPLDAPTVANVALHAALWDRFRAEALDAVRAERLHASDAHEEFLARWNGWTYGDDDRTVPIGERWRTTVTTWLRYGLTVERDFVPAIEIAMRKKDLKQGHASRWAYFCGIMWRIVTEIDERAQAAMTRESHGSGDDQVDGSDYDRGYDAGFNDAYGSRGSYDDGYRACLRDIDLDEQDLRDSAQEAMNARERRDEPAASLSTAPVTIREGLKLLLIPE